MYRPAHLRALKPMNRSTAEQLADIWRRALNCEEIGTREDFFELGGDSLTAAQIVVEIQKTLGVALPITVLHEAPTIERLARIVEGPGGTDRQSCLAGLQPRGVRPPFFCVHGAGGSVLGLTGLANHFPSDQPFYGIRAACCYRNERYFESVEELAAHYVKAVRAVQTHGPYFLGGYSFGGSVALEMAQQFRRSGEWVAFLAILDHTPPPTRYESIQWSPSSSLGAALNFARWMREDIWRAGRGKRWAALKKQFRTAKRRLTKLAASDTALTGDQDVTDIFGDYKFPEAFQRLMEGHYRAMRHYSPRVYAGRITLFRARVRPLLHMHAPDLGWSALAGGGLNIIPVPGNHETMLKARHVKVLAGCLLDKLRNAQLQAAMEDRRVALCARFA
jgi:thioesterase domain-containing protein/acyl carrier protein